MSFQNGFFRNKRILVTGHTGFKGSWLTQMLLVLGAKIYGYALKPNTDPNLCGILGLKESIGQQIGDIRDFQLLNRTVKNFAPEIIFHLAAQPLVRDSYDEPRYTHEVNIMGTVNILEAIRLNHIKAGVIITTDKVYRNVGRKKAFGEDDPLGGYDPYSCSKAGAELVVGSYRQAFFNPDEFGSKHKTLVASVRAGNVIGGGDWAKDRLVPDLVKAFLGENTKVIIRNPEFLRPWQHVLEPLAGYLLLAKSLFKGDATKSGAWNFGPRDKKTTNVEQVVNIFIEIFGKGGYIIERDKTKHEDEILILDTSKARSSLGWRPKMDARQAVEKTALWYNAYYSKKVDMRQYTIRQIKEYFGT